MRVFAPRDLTYLKTAKLGLQTALGRHGISALHLTLGSETEFLGAHYFWQASLFGVKELTRVVFIIFIFINFIKLAKKES